eukprot:5708252-Prymnesium_polylepis.1
MSTHGCPQHALKTSRDFDEDTKLGPTPSPTPPRAPPHARPRPVPNAIWHTSVAPDRTAAAAAHSSIFAFCLTFSSSFFFNGRPSAFSLSSIANWMIFCIIASRSFFSSSLSSHT